MTGIRTAIESGSECVGKDRVRQSHLDVFLRHHVRATFDAEVHRAWQFGMNGFTPGCLTLCLHHTCLIERRIRWN